MRKYYEMNKAQKKELSDWRKEQENEKENHNPSLKYLLQCNTSLPILLEETDCYDNRQGDQIIDGPFLNIINYRVFVTQFKTNTSTINLELDSHTNSPVLGNMENMLDYTGQQVLISGFTDDQEKPILVEVVNDIIIDDCEKIGSSYPLPVDQ